MVEWGWSHSVGDIAFGEHQGLPGDPHHPLVGSATNRRWELPSRLFRDVDADDGEVAVIEFKEVRTARQGDGALSIQVGIGAKASGKHECISL